MGEKRPLSLVIKDIQVKTCNFYKNLKDQEENAIPNIKTQDTEFHFMEFKLQSVFKAQHYFMFY